jgi:hypothetical protein
MNILLQAGSTSPFGEETFPFPYSCLPYRTTEHFQEVIEHILFMIDPHSSGPDPPDLLNNSSI